MSWFVGDRGKISVRTVYSEMSEPCLCNMDKCTRPAEVCVRIWYGQRDKSGAVINHPLYCLDMYCTEHRRGNSGKPDELREFGTDRTSAMGFIHDYYEPMRKQFLA